MSLRNENSDQEAKLIDEMIKTCLRLVQSESGAEFIESMEKQWRAKGWLSQRQRDALKKFHDNL